jgi:predicted GTPase
MAFVQTSSNKDIELTNLETHVALSKQRYAILEERVERAEDEINRIQEQSKATKKAILGAIITVVTSAVSAAGALIFNFLKTI